MGQDVPITFGEASGIKDQILLRIQGMILWPLKRGDLFADKGGAVVNDVHAAGLIILRFRHMQIWASGHCGGT